MSARKVSRLLAAAAITCFSHGCIVLSGTTSAGDRLDARFVLTWETVDRVTGQDVDCRSVGADTVRATAINLDTGEAFVNLFGCRSARGATQRITAGEYAVVAELVDCDRDVTCVSPRIVATAPAAERYPAFYDGDVELEPIVFLVGGIMQ